MQTAEAALHLPIAQPEEVPVRAPLLYLKPEDRWEVNDLYQQQIEKAETMEKALNSMGEPCKSLLEAFYLQKKSMHDIAEVFGYTNAENAKSQKYKCLMKLKKLFFSQK